LADLAVEHEWSAGDDFDVVGTRPCRVGADGTLLVDEFLPLEVAALKGISVAAATWLIRDVVNLKTRHPLMWFQATKGLVPMFRACQLAAEVARFDLSLEEAQGLDAELAPRLPGLVWRRVLGLARGLMVRIAPEKVARLSEGARASRFVRKLPTEDPLVAYLSARVDTADAVFFDAMVDRIADLLGEQGDQDSKDVRRAKAIGVLSTPARAQLMLAEATGAASSGSASVAAGSASVAAGSASVAAGSAIVGAGSASVRSTDPRLLPEATIYVHVAEETLLTGRGTCRVEGVGALAATMLRHLVGHTRIRVTPVIQPHAENAVDAYEIPQRIRRQVILRDTYEVFPYSARSARNQDLDHTIPFREGAEGQTRASNLGPLSRKAHRGKTHGGWQLEQPKPGVFHWESPGGYHYRVNRNGTFRQGDDPLSRIVWDADYRKPPDG
jgi:hypothetical protein